MPAAAADEPSPRTDRRESAHSAAPARLPRSSSSRGGESSVHAVRRGGNRSGRTRHGKRNGLTGSPADHVGQQHGVIGEMLPSRSGDRCPQADRPRVRRRVEREPVQGCRSTAGASRPSLADKSEKRARTSAGTVAAASTLSGDSIPPNGRMSVSSKPRSVGCRSPAGDGSSPAFGPSTCARSSGIKRK